MSAGRAGLSIRPTWYAGPETRLGEFWTMLHVPYTGMVLASAVIGATLAPRLSWTLLGGTLIAYFLGLGIGAHFLDQVPGMGTRYATHWPARALWSVGALALGVAVAIGVVGAVGFVGLPLLLLVGAQAVCAIGYPLASWFGGRLHRDGVFALSWGSLPCLTGFYAQARAITPGALLLAALFGGIALLEIRLSRLSRRLRAEARQWDDRSGPGPDPGTPPFRRFDLALQLLSLGTVVVSVGLVVGRMGLFG